MPRPQPLILGGYAHKTRPDTLPTAEFHPPIARSFRLLHHHKRVIHNGETVIKRDATRENRDLDGHFASNDPHDTRRNTDVARATQSRYTAVKKPA